MSSSTVPSLTRSPRIVPFLLADILLLAVAVVVIVRTPAPMGVWQIALAAACVALAGWFGCLPILIDHRAEVKLAEQEGLATTLEQIQNLETIARQIQLSTGLWQTVQEHSTKVSKAASDIADRMTTEAKAFADFMKRTNDIEKNHLRLEVEKLRRGEGETLQVIVRLMDHIFSLHMAAVRSGQPRLAEQITNFQLACRDAVRRIGLVPFIARPGEPFDGKVHQLIDEKEVPPAEARVAETVGCGYTFQGQLLRPALVGLAATEGSEEHGAAGAAAPAAAGQESSAEPSEPSAESPEEPGRSGQEQLGL